MIRITANSFDDELMVFYKGDLMFQFNPKGAETLEEVFRAAADAAAMNRSKHWTTLLSEAQDKMMGKLNEI